MVQSIAVIMYIVFCLLVALCGSQRRMGFIGTFIVSLLITPVVALIVLLLTGPSQRAEWHRRPQSD
jgi:peptidoglycan/LPS O-acetylase OafA/YrhL